MLEDLTINTGSQNNPDAFTQNFTTGTSNVNLRGLGVSSTLVLINGRRQTQSAVATDRGENFVDTSSLPPMIAFERIEVLKDGATALYGSEAVAGVVNFITRGSFEGFDLELALQGSDNYPQQDVQLNGLYGAGNDNTHVLVAFSHLDREPLTTFERRLSGPTDDLSQAGNPGSFLVPSLPGNPAYRSVWTAAFDSNRNGVADFVEPTLGLPAVPGAQPPVFADQNCTAIAAQDPKVVPAIAVSVPSPIGAIPIGLCAFDFGGFYSIVPEEQRSSAFAELTHVFGDTLEGRIEAHVADNEALRNNSPSFPFAAFPTVAASHPDNPYGSDVRFIGRIIGAGGVPIESIHNSDTWRLAASLTGSLDNTWVWEIGAQYSENDFFVSAPDVLVDRFNLAITGFGGPDCNSTTGTRGVAPCVYFNPFGSSLTGTGTRNSPELLNYLVGFESFDAHSELASLEGFVSRELGELGGGPVGMAVGAQYRADELSYDYDENANRDNFLFLVGNPDFGDDRDIDALVRRVCAAVQRNAEPAIGRPLRGLRRRRRLRGPQGDPALAAVPEVLAARLGRHVVPRAVAVPGVRHANDAGRAHRPQRRHTAVLPRAHAAEPERRHAVARGSRRLQRRREPVADRGLGNRHRLLVVRLHERHHRAERAGHPQCGRARRRAGAIAGHPRRRERSAAARRLVLCECVGARDRRLRSRT